jgi:hypothetical protein
MRSPEPANDPRLRPAAPKNQKKPGLVPRSHSRFSTTRLLSSTQ